MRITSKGQVTIPAEIREKLGLFPKTEVEIVVSRGKVVLRKVSGRRSREKNLVRAARVKTTTRMSTDEIMALMRGD